MDRGEPLTLRAGGGYRPLCDKGIAEGAKNS